MIQQYTQDISPWKEIHQNYFNHPVKQIITRSNSISIKRSSHDAYSTSYSNHSINKLKFTYLQPGIVTPQLFKSQSIKQISLPNFQKKKHLENLEQRKTVKTNQLISMTKSYSKGQLDCKSQNKMIPLNPLKMRLQSILKHQEKQSLAQQDHINRSPSKMNQNRYKTIVSKQQNIIFMYSPLSESMKRNVQQSSRKKLQDHILDKLLSDWK